VLRVVRRGEVRVAWISREQSQCRELEPSREGLSFGYGKEGRAFLADVMELE
jgi:hypothetical protein